MNRQPAAVAFAILLAVFSSGAIENWKTETRPFAPNGTVEIRMPTGDIHIIRANEALSVRYLVKAGDPADSSRVRLRFDRRKSKARIEFEAPVGTAINAEIGVPSPTNLRVHLDSGYVRLDDLPGNREVIVGVGDIGVSLSPKPDDEYKEIVIHTHVGSILAPGLGEIQGYFGKSLQHRGAGHYRMELRTGIGNIELRSTPFPAFPAEN
ncbi:MAG TPA: hypothetical protein VMT20_29430 [Terriglobia bacterium]|nr:hypothetical protein [Terriglobia bacterium]